MAVLVALIGGSGSVSAGNVPGSEDAIDCANHPGPACVTLIMKTHCGKYGDYYYCPSSLQCVRVELHPPGPTGWGMVQGCGHVEGPMLSVGIPPNCPGVSARALSYYWVNVFYCVP